MLSFSFYWKAALFVALISFLSSLVGFGVGSISSALGSLFLDPRKAVGMGNMVFLGTTGTRAGFFQRYIEWRIFPRLLLPAIPGILLGSWAIGHIEPLWIKRFLGLFLILAFPIRLRMGGKEGLDTQFFKGGRVVTGVGLLAGFFSSFAHTGGPLVILLLRGQGLDRMEVVGTASMTFFLFNIFKFLNYLYWGIVGKPEILFGLALAIPAIFGISLGKMTLSRLSERGFEVLIYILFLIIGIRLLLTF